MSPIRNLFLLIVLCAVSLFSQPNNPVEIVLEGNDQCATRLDGSTQDWRKTTPANINLNGSETIPNYTFDANITGWSDGGVITKAQCTNAGRIHTGGGSYAAKNSTTIGGVTRTIFPLQTPYASITWTSAAAVSNWTLEGWAYMPAVDSLLKLALVLCDTAGNVLSTGSTKTLTANTWTKLVLNAAYSGTTTGVGWKLNWITPGRSDSLYLDDASLTHASDCMIVFAYNSPSQPATQSRLVDHQGATLASTGISCYNSSDIATIEWVFNDNVTSATNISVVGILGKFNIACYLFNRTSTGVVYLNGVVGLTSSLTSVGNVNNTNSLGIGNRIAQNGRFLGMIGFVQIVTFTQLPANIASIIAQISSSKQPLNAYPNGTIVFSTDWKNGGRDKSGNGNDLTNTGGAPIVRLRY